MTFAKRALIASGVHITTLEDEAPWKNAAMVRVWPESMDNIGGIAAINAYLSACGLPEWKPDGEKGAEDVKK